MNPIQKTCPEIPNFTAILYKAIRVSHNQFMAVFKMFGFHTFSFSRFMIDWNVFQFKIGLTRQARDW